MVWGLPNTYRYGRPDIIHAHQAQWAGYAAFITSQRHRIPYIVTEHSSGFAERRIPKALKYLRTTYHHAHDVIAVSHALANDMKLACEPSRIHIIPNMVNTDLFVPAVQNKRAGAFIFITVARLVHIKRLDLMVRAFASAFAGQKNINLRIIGQGPELYNLRILIKSLRIGSQVCLLGALRQPNVIIELQNANALVNCSDVETFGVELIEAISCGLPVIATRCGGPEDIVTDEVGILVDCDNTNQLAMAMQQLIDCYSEYSATKLHNFAVLHFGDQSIACELINLYASLLNGKPP